MKKIAPLALLALAVSTLSSSPTALAEQPWFRDAGEYIAFRTTRMGDPTGTNSKIFTDGKRYDVSLGKRLSLLTWSEEGPATAWTAGIDGGMLASLARYSRNGQFTFATNTFDGYFGAYVATGFDGWLVLARFAHLSAHLVDNAPQILNPIAYSHFWEEIVVGKTFPAPNIESHWEIHAQGSIGLNHTSVPDKNNPRAGLGIDGGYAFSGPHSYALLASADLYRAGVENQKPSYRAFLGFGTLNRPGSTQRPFRAGLAHFRGSDYRNQLLAKRNNWTAFEVSTEF